MSKKPMILILAAAAVLLFLLPAFSQEDIKQLADPAFGQAQRPAAVFDHDAHNEKAAIDGCLPCHHQGVEEGRFVEGDPVKCADCHEVKTAEGTPLMLAYHKQCEDCHLEKKKGPVTCGECHKRP